MVPLAAQRRRLAKALCLMLPLLSGPLGPPAPESFAEPGVSLTRDAAGRIRSLAVSTGDGQPVRVSHFDTQGNVVASDGRLYPFQPRPPTGQFPGVKRSARLVREKADALREPVDILFLGDSITFAWPVQAVSAGFSTFNAGIVGFQTAHVLDQLRWGLLRKAKPRLVVLHIGTNDNKEAKTTPVETAESIAAILAKVHAEVPKAKVLLIGIIPRGVDSTDVVRKRNEETNSILRSFQSDPRIRYLDTGSVFVDEQGRARPELYRDAKNGVLVHPSAAGYRAWNRPVRTAIEEMLGSPRSDGEESLPSRR